MHETCTSAHQVPTPPLETAYAVSLEVKRRSSEETVAPGQGPATCPPSGRPALADRRAQEPDRSPHAVGTGELGLYADDRERLGMLSAQAWRAARLVVDTGMHAMGWDRERAVEYLDAATGGPRVNAEVEVDRYIALPGQALAYKIGQREIERIRREAEREPGGRFSLPRFHDRLLALGSLPLPALRREIAAGRR